MSVKLNEEELKMPNRDFLVYYWLSKNIISYQKITQMLFDTINEEREKFKEQLGKSDVFVSTLIDNDKKMMDFQRPRAIEYVIENERMKGCVWYNELLKNNDKKSYDMVVWEER